MTGTVIQGATIGRTVTQYDGNLYDFRRVYIPKMEHLAAHSNITSIRRFLREKMVPKLKHIAELHYNSLPAVTQGGTAADIVAQEKQMPVKLTFNRRGVLANAWDDIKNGINNFVGLINKINPVFVAARAGVLGLIRDNWQGLASKMAAKDISKVRGKWETLGGSWSALRSAIQTGSGKPIGAVGIAPAVLLTAASSITSGGAAGGKKGGADLAGIWKAVEPIIKALTGILGISFNATPPAQTPTPRPTPASTTPVTPRPTTRPTPPPPVPDDKPKDGATGLLIGAAVVALLLSKSK